MPLLSTKAVVNAVVKSTEKHLEFLRHQDRGIDRHPANHIQKAENGDQFIDNSRWFAYNCKLPPHLSLRSDSSATMICHALPGNEIEIRIMEYSRRTGDTLFVARENVTGEIGDIVIDFRWLVQRCLDWFRTRGASLPELEQIAGWTEKDGVVPACHPGLSDKQAKAIVTIIKSGLSYIWGPPGTGKTNWVLAKVVCHCVMQKHKVLVLASTNLAVDNALKAIINDGVEKEKVARIGIPSQNFMDEYPECCEQRAFQSEIRRTESMIKDYAEKIAGLEKALELQSQVENGKTMFYSNTKLLKTYQAELATAKECLRQRQQEAAQAQKKLKTIEVEIAQARNEINKLSLQKIEADIKTLEVEQTRTIKKIGLLRAEILNLGLYSRWFTDRKKRLTIDIVNEEAHLQSVEATLRSKRLNWDLIVPREKALKAGLANLTSSRNEARPQVAAILNEASKLDRKCKDLEEEIAKAQSNISKATERVSKGGEELARLGEHYPLHNSDEMLATWRAKILQLEDHISLFAQDLTNKSVIGMTLDGFIGLTLQTGINVDRVLVDEAPYAPLAKLLPLLSLRCPIAMLGDHCQLPPICECNNDAVIRSYWAKPAIFLEDVFRIGNDFNGLNNLKEPSMNLIARSVLTESYRFGQSLAFLLDQHIYGRIGLVGLADGDTCIRWEHCEPHNQPNRQPRENYSEVDVMLKRIRDWWEWAQQQPRLPTIAILTPYRKQAKLIRRKIENEFRDSPISHHLEVWNTHQAQGREWDWVLFSVSDTTNLEGNEPFFSDSTRPEGKALVNTTISRAKQQLRVFLDASYWRARAPISILTALVREFEGLK